MSELHDPFPRLPSDPQFPDLARELDKLEHPYILLVKDPGGLFCRESLTEKDPTLQLAEDSICLMSLMTAGWLLENGGYERCRAFINRLNARLLAFLADDDRYLAPHPDEENDE